MNSSIYTQAVRQRLLLPAREGRKLAGGGRVVRGGGGVNPRCPGGEAVERRGAGGCRGHDLGRTMHARYRVVKTEGRTAQGVLRPHLRRRWGHSQARPNLRAMPPARTLDWHSGRNQSRSQDTPTPNTAHKSSSPKSLRISLEAASEEAESRRVRTIARPAISVVCGLLKEVPAFGASEKGRIMSADCSVRVY